MKNAKTSACLLAVLLAAGCSGGSLPGGAFSGAASTPYARPSAGSGLVLQTLDVPISQFPTATSTELTGIRGKLITALYFEINGSMGAAVYNRTTGQWTALQFPNATSTASYGPDIASSSSYRIVGDYVKSGSSDSHGFLYASATNSYVTLDAPGKFCGSSTPCNETILHSIYGTSRYRLVGNADNVTAPNSKRFDEYPHAGHAIMYDSKTKTFTNIDMPNSASSTAYGIWIDGGTVAVAGGFTNKKGVHAYVRNIAGSQKLVYDYPKAFITHFEGITGAGGAGNYNVIGDYSALKNKHLGYGFFLPIRKWKAGIPIVIGEVSANSVYQRDVVGVYGHAGHVNGYITTIPTPN